jgi:hypothetical protein
MASKDPLDRIVIQGGQLSRTEAISRFAPHGLVALGNQRRELNPGLSALQICPPVRHKQCAGSCDEHCKDCSGGHQNSMHDQ